MNLPLHQLIPDSPVELLNHTIDTARTVLTAASPSASRKSCVYSLYPPRQLGHPLAYSETGLRTILPYDGASNLLFLLPCGTDKLSRSVYVWDDTAQEVVIELEHREEVLRIQCRRDKLVVMLRRKVLLYHLDFTLDRDAALTKEADYETCDNPLGRSCLPMPYNPDTVSRSSVYSHFNRFFPPRHSRSTSWPSSARATGSAVTASDCDW